MAVIGDQDGIAAACNRLRDLDPKGTALKKGADGWPPLSTLPADLSKHKAWDKLQRTLQILADDHDAGGGAPPFPPDHMTPGPTKGKNGLYYYNYPGGLGEQRIIQLAQQHKLWVAILVNETDRTPLSGGQPIPESVIFATRDRLKAAGLTVVATGWAEPGLDLHSQAAFIGHMATGFDEYMLNIEAAWAYPQPGFSASDQFAPLVRGALGQKPLSLCPDWGNQIHWKPWLDVGMFAVRVQCVAPETRVLTKDLRWVPAGELSEGDLLIAPQEFPGAGRSKAHRMALDSQIVGLTNVHREGYAVYLSDGTMVRCSGDHPWLVNTHVGSRWTTADEMHSYLRGHGLRKVFISRYMTPWSEMTGREAGWLAGIFDGEGSFTATSTSHGASRFVLCMNQKPGLVLDETLRLLDKQGLRYNRFDRDPSGVTAVHINGRWQEKMALLGMVRPLRLLDKFVRLPMRRQLAPLARVEVVEMRRIGRLEVVPFQTTSRTFFAEGFAAHNCYLNEWPHKNPKDGLDKLSQAQHDLPNGVPPNVSREAVYGKYGSNLQPLSTWTPQDNAAGQPPRSVWAAEFCDEADVNWITR